MQGAGKPFNTDPSDPGDSGLWLPHWRTCHPSLVHPAAQKDTSELVSGTPDYTRRYIGSSFNALATMAM